MRECMSHDFKYWKVRRFVYPYSAYEEVIELVRVHFEQLKEIFISAMCEYGTPPDFRK